MKNITKYLWLLTSLVLVAGCAHGPAYNQVSGTFPALDPDQGRIFIYRTSAMGAAVQPHVMLNGESVGRAKPKGFFYVDRPPGDYEIVTTTEVKRTASLSLEKGQTQYVRLNISMGIGIGHVNPVSVDPVRAKKEIQHCRYTGVTQSKP